MPVFKSLKSTLWPVYLEIANLPPSLRFWHEHVVTAALWFGQSKPNMETLLRPIMEKIDYFNTVFSSDNSVTIRYKNPTFVWCV